MTAPAIALALVAAIVTGAVAAAPLDAPVAATHEEAKPSGPIAVDVRLAAVPALGVPLTVTVTARAEAIDRLELEVHTDDSVALVIGAQSSPVDRAGARSWVVTVVPTRASGGNLSVVVAGEIDGVAQAQSVTTKVRPAGAVPSVRALSIAPAEGGGENLSLLPVEERF
jgi:hypothetical protein